MSRPPVLALAVAALVAAAAAPAAHAAGWVAGDPLSPGDRVAAEPHVTVTASGERVLAWIQEAANGFTSENVSIRTATPGGDFGPTQTFPGNAFALQTATAADGTLALAWIDSSARAIRVARRAPGQAAFAEVTPFVVPNGESPFEVAIAFNGAELVGVVAGGQQTGGRQRSIWAFHLTPGAATPTLVQGPGAGGSLEHADNLQGQRETFLNSVDIAVSAGRTVAVWENQLDGTPAGQTRVNNQTTVKWSQRLPGGATFLAPFPQDTTFNDGFFHPDMDPTIAGTGGAAGDIWVQWTRERVNTILAQDITRAATQTTIPSPGFIGRDSARTAVDDAGNLTVAWESERDGFANTSVYAATVPAGATTGVAAPVGPESVGRDLGAFALAGDGTALISPVRPFSSSDRTIQVDASLRPAGGAFSPLESVSGIRDATGAGFFADEPGAFVAPGGRALVAWTAADPNGGPGMVLRVSERDTTPPAIAALDIPQTVVAGQRITYSATATDALSTPTVSWDFGDGSQVSGASVTHVYGTAGAATVTVTARDSAGNVTTQSALVAVTPAPAPPADPGVDGPPGVPPRDTTAPVVSGLSSLNKRFRVATGSTAVVAGRKAVTPLGTTLRMRLSERATLAVAVGLRKGKRTVQKGTLVRTSVASGGVALRFSGRIGKAALAPGSYVATVTAVDGSGNRSKPVTVKFTIVRK